jgi:hypothetical protein
VSFTISIKDGDIELKGNTFAIVTGTKKLEQEMEVWLKERFGSDRFHTNYGSTLDHYIGSVMSDSAVYEIESEVGRVLRNYQALQHRKFQGDPQSLDPSEILAEINSVVARPNYDRVDVTVHFSTYRGTTSTISVNIGG